MPSPQLKGYNNNPNLPKAGYTHAYTQLEKDEFKKCAKDVAYFARSYMKIVTTRIGPNGKPRGLINFELFDFQEELLHTFQNNRFVICKFPRQSGKSTTTIAFILHFILFNKNVNVAVLANKGSTAKELLGRLQLAYEYLPRFLQQGIVIWNKGNIELSNGSKVIAAATSASGVRGSTYDLIFLDEFAHIQGNIQKAFFDSTYPTISAGETTKVIIISTPLGMNLFYKLWTEAVEKKSNYIPVDIHWSDVPGRDEKWKEETIANTSEEQFQQEFCTEFLGSARTLISGSKLSSMMYKKPIYKEHELDVYEHPKPEKVYILTVDVSHGQGRDYQAFSVIDVSQISYRQIAKYRNNHISPLVFPTIIYTVAKKYNDAYVLIEINDIGQQVADIMHSEFGYENLLKIFVKGKFGQRISAGFQKKIQLGVKTSAQVKRIGCANLKTLIESNKLITWDYETISEFRSFIASRTSYEAEEGKNDDLVMTLVIFGWISNQQYFKEAIKSDIRKNLQEYVLNVYDEDIIPPLSGLYINDQDNSIEKKYYRNGGMIWVDDKIYPDSQFNWDENYYKTNNFL